MTRLAFFPEPFEDELLYGLMARVREMMGISHHAAVTSFFGTGQKWVTVDLPVGLDRVSARIGREVMSCADLIDRHTLFAYYMRFLDRSAYGRAREVAADGWKGVGPTHLKLHASGIVSPRRLRFCPDCVHRDRVAAGIAGWRRSHQCPGVFVCPEHGTGLLESGVGSTHSGSVIACPGDGGGVKPVPNPFRAATAGRIASATAWLLAHPQEPVGIAGLCERTRSLLGDSGWITASRGRVNIGDLHAAILGYYGAECLRVLGMNPGAVHWVAQTYRGSPRSRTHPLHHLLLLEFLHLGPSDLFDARIGGRWAAPRPGRSPRTTVVWRPRECSILRHRAKVEGFLKKVPDASRNDVTGAHGWAVDVLRKHDRSWLDAVLPVGRRRPISPVDWARRDRELAEKVLRAVQAVRSASDRPQRITRTRLVRLVDFPRLALCLPRLPETANALAASVEDELAFQRRQLRWAAERLVGEDAGSCTRAKLIAHVKRKKTLRAELLPEVDELVSEINSGSVFTRPREQAGLSTGRAGYAA